MSKTICIEGRNLSLSAKPLDPNGVKSQVFSDGTIVVGYLAIDDSGICPNPLRECDGMGRVYTSRRGDQEGHAGMQRAFGLDRYWQRDPELTPDPYAVVLDVFEHGETIFSVQGEGIQCKFDTARGAAVWVPDDEAKKHIEYEGLRRLLPEGTKAEYKRRGDEYNAIAYVLPDGSTHGRFESFRLAIRAAAAVLGIELTEETLALSCRAVAVEVCRHCLETYNDWLNGAIYEYLVEVFADDPRAEETDSLGGMIGADWAEQNLTEAFEDRRKQQEDPARFAMAGI